jgi:putative ABC transport system permease protein
MRFDDIIRFSLNSLMHRGLRSWLTIFGVVIGVAAVVSIISIGSGTQEAITSQLSGLGANMITVTAGSGRAAFGGGGGVFISSTTTAATSTNQNVNHNLTVKDLQTIRSVPDVQYVDGMVSGRVEVVYLAQTTNLNVEGVDPIAWRQMTTTQLDSGRYLSEGDSNSIVIGYSVANTVFKQPLGLNTQISVGGRSFKVVGIMQQSGGFGGTDNQIIMPINAARTVITDVVENQFSSIQVQVSDASLVNATSNAINQKLLVLRHVTESTKDFSITSSQSLQQTISSVTNTLSLFLVGIAAISLLVGAIGIANTMFMSVMERTRQIGVLKALGTTDSEVTQLFLMESSIMGLIGGLMGIFLGFIASGIVSEIGVRFLGAAGGPGARNLTSLTYISPDLVLFALVFSIIIGAISGYLPARRAAKLQPVEALRYE